MTRPRTQPKRLGELVPSVLRELGLAEAAVAANIAEHWDDWVVPLLGPEVGRHAQAAALREGVLEIVTDSSTCSQQLQLRNAELLEVLRQRLGNDAPRSIRLRVGRLAGHSLD